MVKRGGRAIYKTINLPQELLDQVDDFIKKNPIFRSRAEFTKEAIKQKLEAPWIPPAVELGRLSKKDQKQYWRNLLGKDNFDLLISGRMTPEEWFKEKMGMIVDPKTKEIKKFNPSLKNISNQEILQSIKAVEKRLTTIEKKLKK